MMNIMIRDCNVDSIIADYCLEHQQDGSKSYYLDPSYEDKVEAFEKFWNKINTVITY